MTFAQIFLGLLCITWVSVPFVWSSCFSTLFNASSAGLHISMPSQVKVAWQRPGIPHDHPPQAEPFYYPFLFVFFSLFFPTFCPPPFPPSFTLPFHPFPSFTLPFQPFKISLLPYLFIHSKFRNQVLSNSKAEAGEKLWV